MASKYSLNQVADKQAVLLKKLKAMPASDEASAILDLLEIQLLMAHIVADHINVLNHGK